MNKGIAVVGNILTDNVKIVSTYPEKGMLATIESESLAVGGCVPNTGIDLKKIDKTLPVTAVGKIGDDDKGAFVLNKMEQEGLDVSLVKKSKTAPTSYSDVITVKGTGERTFFHNRGANAEFNLCDVDLDKINADVLHFGYLMLLDSFDKFDADGNTYASKLLKSAKEKGFKTSIDIVSESSGNFNKVVSSALPYCDYVIINEIEAGNIVGINVRDKNDNLIDENVILAMKKIFALGVKEKIIVHCVEKGFSMNADLTVTIVESKKLPSGFIKGSVGAGDAFCAGSLYSIYKGYDDKKLLTFSNLVAISCLSESDSISGVKSAKEIEKYL